MFQSIFKPRELLARHFKVAEGVKAFEEFHTFNMHPNYIASLLT